MRATRTDRPFADELPRLLRERGMNVRELADEIGVSDSHLYRIVRRTDYKTASAELTRRVAAALGLRPDFFLEARQGYVVDRVKSDPRLCNRLYTQLRAQEGQRRGRR